MKKVVSLLLALVLVFALCACGKKEDPKVGVYKAIEMSSDGMDLLALMQGMGQEFNAYLVLNSDGTGSLDLGDEDKTELKWDDKTLSSADGSDPINYTFDNGKITFEEDGTKMVFEKLSGDELAAYQKNNK